GDSTGTALVATAIRASLAARCLTDKSSATRLSIASVAVVSGGNRGIGLETCRQLADRGFDVVLGSRDLEKGRAAAVGLGSTAGRVLPFQLDVADAASVRRLADDVARELG